jgi:hypothetical protein
MRLASAGFRFVQVGAADRGVGQDGHAVRLHFQDAAGHEDEFFFGLARHLDAHRARTDARDQRGVLRVDTQLARFTRQRDELGFARKDLLFGRDHVNVNSVCHVCPFEAAG